MRIFKSFKLLIIALVVCNNIFSQINVYKPFPQTNGTWIVEDYYNIMSGGQHKWEKYETLGDTIIGSYTYKKVSRAVNTGYPNGQNVVPFGPSSFNFAYRNDIGAKKVYRNLGINHDTLWYDFNLNVGDTIKNSYSNNSHDTNPVLEKVIQSIDSIFVCGIYYKKFVYCGSYNEGSLIEGIGFKSNFIKGYTSECPPFEPSELFYTTFSTCNFVGINEANNFKTDIELYPNPSYSEIKLNSTVAFIKYTITNALGEVVLKGNYSINESIKINTLTNGLYSFNMIDKQNISHQLKFIKQ